MTREEQIDWLCRLRADLNNGIILTPWNKEFTEALNDVLEQESCDDCISRRGIKQKLQEHHDFFVNAYGGFSNLPQNDKSRVDEITNCIAMVVNEPSVTPQPKTGRWEWVQYDYNPNVGNWHCSECRNVIIECDTERKKMVFLCNYCPNCGAKMEGMSE